MQMWQIALIATGVIALVGVSTSMLMMHETKPLQAYDPAVIQAYKDFTVKFNKKQGDPDYAAYRLGIFALNYASINAHNAQTTITYTKGINQFADLTQAEFKKTYLGLLPIKPKMHRNIHKMTGAVANSVDWRTKGAVTAIKDQGQCGSCWAFSTTGSTEGAHFLAGNPLISLSEQQLVDCSTAEGNQGCDGGLMDQAFTYIEKNNGIALESAYPYKAVDGSCKKSVKSAATIKTYTDVTASSPSALLSAVNIAPVSVAVDAEEWQFYSGGVFSDCGDSLDHGVLAVGYDGSSNWIVKNSWGTSWGESGYITLAAGNTCGIADAASYPTA